MWDTIVLGSGIGGLTAAAALARCGQRVLVLEQHGVAGGLTQTFQRHDWSFATGVHYVSGVDAPGLTVAVERGRALVDAHDQADAVLQVLVGEAHAVSDTEVAAPGDLGRRCGLALS